MEDLLHSLKVHGWIRKEINMDVPTPLMDLIGDYAKPMDKFCPNGKLVDIEESNSIASCPQEGWLSIYGEAKVNHGLNEWKIRILKPGRSLIFGIVSSDIYPVDHWHNRPNKTEVEDYYFSYGYGCENDDVSVFKPQTSFSDVYEKKAFKADEIIRLLLDFDEGILKIWRSDVCVVECIKIENDTSKYNELSYRLAVANYWAGTKIELLSCSQLKRGSE